MTLLTRPCAGGGPSTVCPLAALLPERTTPELLLQEAKYAALTSYGAAARLLDEAFPLGRALQPAAVRQQVERTAERSQGMQDNQQVGEIPNCGERYRCGEPISTATAEATVNRVISRRMVKKQQMRWSPRGAHLLLQVRTRVLNDDLATDFARWYPGLASSAPQTDGAA